MVHFVYHPRYYCDIGPHVFPMEKFRMVFERLKKEAELDDSLFITPEPASREMLEAVHTPAYLDALEELRMTPEIISSELPISREIVDAYKLAAGGTVRACEAALETGCAVNLTGGFHHAFADKAEGFCYINDIAVGIRWMQRKGRIERAFVVDCDLHQGNGTAVIFRNAPEVFTFSIHQEHLYPVKQKSDLDIGLDFFTDDDTYLALLEKHVPRIMDEHGPDLVIYVAGADPYKEDVLGNLALTKEGLSRRDTLIFSAAKERGIPVTAVLAGGYAQRVEDTVDIHFTMCLNALHTWGGGETRP